MKQKSLSQKERLLKKCCRGPDSYRGTGQLVPSRLLSGAFGIQSSVVDPGRPAMANETALYYVYPVFPTPETRGSLLLVRIPKNKDFQNERLNNQQTMINIQ